MYEIQVVVLIFAAADILVFLEFLIHKTIVHVDESKDDQIAKVIGKEVHLKAVAVLQDNSPQLRGEMNTRFLIFSGFLRLTLLLKRCSLL